MSVPSLVLRSTASLDDTRVLCVPHMGAGSGAMRGFIKTALEGHAVGAVRFPGRESRIREKPAQSVAALVQEVIAAAFAFHGNGPLWLIGQCSGALLAFEAALHLAGTDRAVAGIVAVSSGGPSWPVPRPDITSQVEIRDFLRTYGGTDDQLLDNPMLMELLLPQVLADLRAFADYHPSPRKWQGKAMVVRTADDPIVPAEASDLWSHHVTEVQHITVGTRHLLLTEEPAEVWRAVITHL